MHFHHGLTIYINMLYYTQPQEQNLERGGESDGNSCSSFYLGNNVGSKADPYRSPSACASATGCCPTPPCRRSPCACAANDDIDGCSPERHDRSPSAQSKEVARPAYRSPHPPSRNKSLAGVIFYFDHKTKSLYNCSTLINSYPCPISLRILSGRSSR